MTTAGALQAGDTTPTGILARVKANLAALRVRNALKHEKRPATSDELEVLRRFTGWGATGVSKIFLGDTGPETADDDSSAGSAAISGSDDPLAEHRTHLQTLLTDDEYAAARRTTINAHYTSPELVHLIWQAVAQLGFTGGDVLEFGCGTGNFIAGAPAGAHV